MPWQSSRRERIMVFGGYKSGKTYAYLSIMQLAEKTNTNSHFWIIDNDNQAEASGLGENGSFKHLLHRATIWTPTDFSEYRDITADIIANAGPEDWIIIDMLSNVWEQMPSWWMNNVYGEDEFTYWVQVRREIIAAEEAGKRGHEKQFGGTAGVDWQMIGKAYRGWEKRISLGAPCHVYVTSNEAEIDERFDKSGQQRQQYAVTNAVGPKTEKGVGHRFHTIMRMAKLIGRDGKTAKTRELTVVGDRDREAKWAEKFGRAMTMEMTDVGTPEQFAKAPIPKLGFAFDYLFKLGGWRLGGKK